MTTSSTTKTSRSPNERFQLPYQVDRLQRPFEVVSDYVPQGDQPKAIESLVKGIQGGQKHQVLLGVTGSGKTFSMAQVIAQVNRPALVMAPNKTLAAQLYSEFKSFFPKNAVEYFVSYYDYYQPEAYIPSTNTYIEKDSAINEEIDKLRHSATRSLLDRRDVIIVSSVSCIYGLGSPEAYQGMLLYFEEGRAYPRKDILNKLVEIQYERSDVDFHRGTFRVRGDVIDIFPAYEEDVALRIELFGDVIESVYEIDALRGKRLRHLGRVTVYPATHYVTDETTRRRAIESIRLELRERLQVLKALGKTQEAERLESRTLLDLEMMAEIGYCQGVENYSRHLLGGKAGDPPATLIDYFPKDYLLLMDESHVTVPQVGGMYRGDRARKETLVEHGFRLPSALDNRPLNFQEFEERMGTCIYVSATPGDYELQQSHGEVVEQIIRPTGLLDPLIEVRPAEKQVQDLFEEASRCIADGSRVLVTTLTKKLAEDLTQYLAQKGLLVKYLHSDIDTLDRVEILRELRQGKIHVLVGINLLREGLDLPEVALVAILDADKEGFLRSPRSLIQTIGRAARNVNGRVIMYADHVTRSMSEAMSETSRRRSLQQAYNEQHGIVPTTIKKAIRENLVGAASSEGESSRKTEAEMRSGVGTISDRDIKISGSSQDHVATDLNLLDSVVEAQLRVQSLLGVSTLPSISEIKTLIEQHQKKMREAAAALEFEKAVSHRDLVKALQHFLTLV